jgi:hypothetical protein
MAAPTRRSPSGTERQYTRQLTLTWGLIAAGAESTITSAAGAIPEARLGDVVTVSPPLAGLAAGMVIAQAWVPAAGQISVSLVNTTAGGLTPGAVILEVNLAHQ